MSVVIYSTPSCGWCHKAKEYFSEKGVSYIEYNVAEDQAKAEEMINKSNQMGVPVIEIDGKIIVGYDKEAIDAALSIK